MSNHPKAIYVHCTATPEGRATSVDEIRAWHKTRGFVDIGYHKVVLLDGSVANGRDLDNDGDVEEHMGAHTYGWNKDSLAVSYVGGMDAANKRPKDTRTLEQHAALLAVVKDWMVRFNIPITKVFGHYEKDPGKACPSFDMGKFRQDLVYFEAPEKAVAPSIQYPVIKVGDTGFAVQILQALLAAFFPRDWEGDFHGVFTDYERQFVVTAQQALGVVADGIVGPKTWLEFLTAMRLRWAL